jgi:hypothetical protein
VPPELMATLFLDMISRRLQLYLLVGAVRSVDVEQTTRTVNAAVKMIASKSQTC